jgi:hypothetical protein
MAALQTVADYIASARRLLQDETTGAYRYSDAALVEALNIAILEARRLRPDLFLGRFDALPEYSVGSPAEDVVIDPQFRSAFLYYVCGHVQLSDTEDVTDSRGAVFLSRFTSQLTTLTA